jgi:undecaprenyl diphosphate synthase
MVKMIKVNRKDNNRKVDNPMDSRPSVPQAAASLPAHVAIIMDGNGRWAKARGRNRLQGHQQGAESVREIVEACRELNIPALTLYAFSEENWSRSQFEVRGLMKLLSRFLQKERERLLRHDIRLNAIGNLAALPAATRKNLEAAMEATRGCRGMILTLALSYGGRQEIAAAADNLVKLALRGEISRVDEETFAAQLMTANPLLPEPDLLIRTSGELRISNFLLWQLAYTEFYFTQTLWPDFRKPDLLEALAEFARRQRRYGGVQET